MNLLDENIPEHQRQLLWRLHAIAEEDILWPD